MNRYHRRKFEASPGMTGLWQVLGRPKNQRDFNSVAAYDVYYIENWSLMQDLKILLKTIPVVLLQKGAC
jgi:lipopolysaccharide/colanic/teichoic acid biosynthesis glycosyltransferase